MEYLVKEGFTRARKEKRKTVYYKDLGKNVLSKFLNMLFDNNKKLLTNSIFYNNIKASSVSEVEQFEFLEDVIPHTMTLKAALERRKDTLDEGAESSEPARKKSKLDKNTKKSNDNNGVEQEEEEEEDEDEDEQISEQDPQLS